jgi:hypothetical protein
VRDMEEKSRRNYRIFQLERNSAIRQQRESERSRISDVREKRQVELREVVRMEIEMLQRQSRSREAVESSLH